MQYQMLSSYQYLSSPGQTSNNNASSSPTKKRKRLTYVPVCKSPVQSDKGAVFRANLNKQYNVRDDDDDDETQDIISDKAVPSLLQLTPVLQNTGKVQADIHIHQMMILSKMNLNHRDLIIITG